MLAFDTQRGLRMKSWSDAIFNLLLVSYCVFGTNLVDKYVFNHEPSRIRLGLLMTAVFISAYPIFGWRRNSPSARLGRWSFLKWTLFGGGLGIVTIIVHALSRAIVRYYGA